MQNVPLVNQTIKNDQCLFGTVDSWLIWNLTGGPNSGKHVTDVTNASRTMLMNLETLQWDKTLLTFFEIPKSVLPEIKSSSEVYGSISDGIIKVGRIALCIQMKMIKLDEL